MKDSLQPGLKFEFQFQVPETKTVPYLYPESPEFQLMPRVLATGYMVGLFEWACIQALNPHLDWPREQTVGIHVDLDHTAATPPGLVVTVRGTLTQVEGRKLTFALEADDGVDRISQGHHVRFVIDAAEIQRQGSGQGPSRRGRGGVTGAGGRDEDLAFLERLAATLMDASFCPLGQSAAVPLLSPLKNFRPEIDPHIREKSCPAGVCQMHTKLKSNLNHSGGNRTPSAGFLRPSAPQGWGFLLP